MVLSAGSDASVSLWTVTGCHVGNYGRDTWLCANPDTYRENWSTQYDSVYNAQTMQIAATDAFTAEADSSDDARVHGELYVAEEDGKPQEDDESTPTMIIAALQFEGKGVKKDKRLTVEDRVFLPAGSPLDRPLNHAHVKGRKSTSVHHLLHIHELDTAAPDSH